MPWVDGGTVTIKATAEQTDGKYAAAEFWLPRGVGSPVHIHSDEDEFFVVLDGEVRFRLGDDIVDAGPHSFVYGPRGVAHGFTVNSDGGRVLLLFGPGGVENFFRDASAYFATVPAGQQPDPQKAAEINARYRQQVVGPPVPPKDL